MSDSLFKDAFENVFAGTADSSRWQYGFEDAIAGKKAQSEERNYLSGYGVGYEYSERQSALSEVDHAR